MAWRPKNQPIQLILFTFTRSNSAWNNLCRKGNLLAFTTKMLKHCLTCGLSGDRDVKITFHQGYFFVFSSTVYRLIEIFPISLGSAKNIHKCLQLYHSYIHDTKEREYLWQKNHLKKSPKRLCLSWVWLIFRCGQESSTMTWRGGEIILYWASWGGGSSREMDTKHTSLSVNLIKIREAHSKSLIHHASYFLIKRWVNS
jgi:hypothetical protein